MDTTLDVLEFEVSNEVSKMDKAGVYRLQLDQLLQEGILIDLDISGESMFTRLADWSELGVPLDDIRASRFTRGQKHLVDEKRVKALKSITTRARQWLDKLSANVAGFRPYRYLHYKRYDEWLSKWQELQTDFDQAKQGILDHYNDDVEAIRQDFEEVAYAAWKSIAAQGYEHAIVGGIVYSTLEDFTAALVGRALDKMPSRDKIEHELRMDYRVSMIEGREQVARAEAAAQIAHAEAEAKALEIYNQSKIIGQKAQHEHELQLLEEDHLQKMHMLEEQERRLRINAMLKAEADHIREQYASQISPVEQIFIQVRQEMAEAAAEITASIQKNGRIHGKVAERARGLLDVFNLMAIQDDMQLHDRLAQLREAIAVGANDSPSQDVETALEGIRELVYTAKEDLLAGPSRFSLIDVD